MERRREDYPSASTPPIAKLDRKTVEKNRRAHMNSLLHNLFSLVPPQHFIPSKEGLAVPELLEQATGCIVQLKEQVQQLKERKAEIEASKNLKGDEFDSTFPVLKITKIESRLQVVLIDKLSQESFAVSQLVRVLEDEGAQVVAMNMITLDDKVYHTLNAQVKSPRVGVDTCRIAGRLECAPVVLQ